MRAMLYCLVVLLTACGGSGNAPGAGIAGVAYVGLTVADLDASTQFYAAANLAEVPAATQGALEPIAQLAGKRPDTRLLRSSNAQLRLLQFSAGPTANGEAVPVQGPGIAHVCYQVNKATGSYERFLAAGAVPIGAREMIQLSERNPVEYAYARDLDGVIFEVEHVDVTALELEQPPANDYRIRHVSIATPDIGAALNFYSALLGGQKPRRAGRFFSLSGEKVEQISGLENAALKMGWLQTLNLELEFVQYTSHPTARPVAPRPLVAPGYNMIVFDVADLSAAKESLLAAGGSVVSDATAMDGGQVLLGRDPDGNLLGFQIVDVAAPVSAHHFPNNGL
ncbi:MAG: VOC family protein [Halioglobus sp.]|nr:VOC family protein [Halioglobus sp.]